MTTKTTESFDCVEMMHAGALRIYEETKGMDVEEELEYWRRPRRPIKRDDAPRQDE